MKRFILSILFVSVGFIGVGALVDSVGAKFKSDEKALEIVRKARIAIGGDTAIARVQSLLIIGQTTSTVKMDGVDQTRQGDTEIAMQLPDKLMKTIKIGHGDQAGGEKTVEKQFDVVVMGNAKDHQKVIVHGEGNGMGKGSGEGADVRVVIKKDDGTVQELTGADAHKIIVRKSDGENKVWTDKDGKSIRLDDKHAFMNGAGDHHGAMRQNELLRLTLGLLLTAPQGMDVNYTFAGESIVDGTACNIVVAEFGGSSFKIYLGQTSNLPVMMSYTGVKMPVMMTFTTKTDAPADGAKDTMIFRTADGPAPEKAEFNVKCSDYRSVGGVQLPYKWTQTIDGNADETFDVTSYEINPANIADRFQNHKVMVRTKKPDSQ